MTTNHAPYRVISYTLDGRLSYELATVEGRDIAVRVAEAIKDDRHRSRVEIRDADDTVIWFHDRRHL